MADIHIDEFYQDCANVLVQLYTQFPRRTSLYVNDITTPEPPDEFGIPSRRHQACFDAFLWLQDEGYIRYEDRVRMEGLDQVVLTEKSFVRLSLPRYSSTPEDKNIPPTLAQKHASLGWQLRKAVRDGTTSEINQLCFEFFQ